MKRVEKEKGFINIKGVKNKMYFLTSFIESRNNHNPEKRAIGELPNTSIVKDTVNRLTTRSHLSQQINSE